MPTYRIKGPDGRTIDITGDKPPTADVVSAAFEHAGGAPPTLIGARSEPHGFSDRTDEPQPSAIGNAAQGSGLLQGMAHPQGLGDLLSLLLPNPLGQSMNLGTEAMAAGRAARPEMTGIVGKTRASLAGIVDRWKGPQPLTDAERATAGTLGRDVPLPSSTTVQPAQTDAWDRMLEQARQARKPTGPPPVLRKGTGAPTLTESIQSALEEAGKGNPAKGTTPPAPTITSAGKEGAFTSSGRPSVTGPEYDKIAQGRTTPPPAPPAPPKPPPPKPPTPLKDQPLFRQQAAMEKAEPAAAAASTKPNVGGPTVMGKGGDASTKLADDITSLRRKYGADRIGKVVNPKAPEAGTGDVLRADASQAGSAMPDIAQEALLRDLKAGKTSDPSKTLRALSQLLKEYKRNNGPANSPVAKELADLLRKHGFNQ